MSVYYSAPLFHYKQMVVGKCNYIDVKRKKSLETIECLPDELVFDILVHLSAEDIYNGAMLVSRKWYNMIRSHDFIHAHLQHSTPGLLLQYYERGTKTSSFVAIRQGRIEVSKLSYKIRGNGLWDSCNGLILEDRFPEILSQIHITNPAIKQILEILPFSWKEQQHHWWSIAHSAASKEYKVVHTYEFFRFDIFQCDILTVGVDKSWRPVSTQHLSHGSKFLFLNNSLCKKTVATEGFIHFVGNYHNHVLTLNVETETIAENPIPQGLEGEFKSYWSTGKSLSMFVGCGELCLEGWEMKSETGEWTKMYKIDLFAHKFNLEELCRDTYMRPLVPWGWLKYPEVLVLRFYHQTRICIAYNVRTHEIDSFELDGDICVHDSRMHRNSLVGLVSS